MEEFLEEYLYDLLNMLDYVSLYFPYNYDEIFRIQCEIDELESLLYGYY